MKEYLKENDPALLTSLEIMLSRQTLTALFERVDARTAELEQEIALLENQIQEQGEQ